MSAKKETKFPSRLYVTREEDGDYFVAVDDLMEHAHPGEEIPVAIYDLKEVGVVKTKMTFVADSP